MRQNILGYSRNDEHQFVAQLTAVILAGGLGTRLRSVIPDQAKVMANVAGRPFLTYILDQIVRAGIKRAVICTGYLADSISTVLHDDYQGLQLVYSQETKPLGTAGALRNALPLIKTFPTLVLNGDSFVNVDLEQFVQFHFARRCPMTLTLAKKECSGAFGLVELGQDEEVKKFSEKEHTGKSAWVNAGMYLMDKQVIELIPKNQAVSLEQEILPKWVGRGLHGYPQEEELFDIGTPSSLSEAHSHFGEYGANVLTYS